MGDWRVQKGVQQVVTILKSTPDNEEYKHRRSNCNGRTTLFSFFAMFIAQLPLNRRSETLNNQYDHLHLL